jgi:hypothetical protein
MVVYLRGGGLRISGGGRNEGGLVGGAPETPWPVGKIGLDNTTCYGHPVDCQSMHVMFKFILMFVCRMTSL